MNAVGRQVVGGTVWPAVERWGRQIAVFGVVVMPARHLGAAVYAAACFVLARPDLLNAGNFVLRLSAR
jgi:hypothetical protein